MLYCPLCRRNTVEAPSFDFASTSVEVPVCTDCSTRTGAVSATLRKSALLDLEPPTYVLRHSEGLVALG